MPDEDIGTGIFVFLVLFRRIVSFLSGRYGDSIIEGFVEVNVHFHIGVREDIPAVHVRKIVLDMFLLFKEDYVVCGTKETIFRVEIIDF